MANFVAATPLTELERQDDLRAFNLKEKRPNAQSATAFYQKKKEVQQAGVDGKKVKKPLVPLIPREWVVQATWRQGGLAPDKPSAQTAERGPVPCRGDVEFMVDAAMARALHDEPDLKTNKKEVARLRKAIRSDCLDRWGSFPKEEKKPFKEQAAADKERFKREMAEWRAKNSAAQPGGRGGSAIADGVEPDEEDAPAANGGAGTSAAAQQQAQKTEQGGKKAKKGKKGEKNGAGSSKDAADAAGGAKKAKKLRKALLWAEGQRRQVLGEEIVNRKKGRSKAGAKATAQPAGPEKEIEEEAAAASSDDDEEEEGRVAPASGGGVEAAGPVGRRGKAKKDSKPLRVPPPAKGREAAVAAPKRGAKAAEAGTAAGKALATGKRAAAKQPEPVARRSARGRAADAASDSSGGSSSSSDDEDDEEEAGSEKENSGSSSGDGGDSSSESGGSESGSASGSDSSDGESSEEEDEEEPEPAPQANKRRKVEQQQQPARAKPAAPAKKPVSTAVRQLPARLPPTPPPAKKKDMKKKGAVPPKLSKQAVEAAASLAALSKGMPTRKRRA